MTEVWKIIRFGFVGILATLMHIIVVTLLTYFTPLHPVIINTLAFAVAFCVSSTGHMIFTFQVHNNQKNSLIKYFFVAVAALILSNILLAFMLKQDFTSQYIAQLTAILSVPIVTYIASRYWAFALK